MQILPQTYYRTASGYKCYVGYYDATTKEWVGHLCHTDGSIGPTKWSLLGVNGYRDSNLKEVWKDRKEVFVNCYAKFDSKDYSWTAEHDSIESARAGAAKTEQFLGCFKCVYEDDKFISSELMFTR